MAATQDILLYYNELSSPSRKVLIALHEKGVNFVPRLINLTGLEQYEDWYLKINPRGEVPVLQHGDQTIVESNRIIEYIDRTFGQQNMLLPSDNFSLEQVRHFVARIDSIPMAPLTFGAVIFHTEHVTESLRYPFCREESRNKLRDFFPARLEKIHQKSVEYQGSAIGDALREKALASLENSAIFTDLSKYNEVLAKVESVLDEIEATLESESHVGVWLCGPTFTVADICLVALLLRLHQLGFDDRMWKGGLRPHVAVYQEMAFKRASFIKATKWNEHKDEVFHVKQNSDSGVDSATLGLGVVLALGAAYLFKKFRH